MLNKTNTMKGSVPFLAFILMSSAAHAQYSGNVLVNSGFEDDVMSSYGNHTQVNQNNQPTGWAFGGGSRPNIVKVDGPGGQAEWYGNSGPDSDATASGAGVDRQYLDITNGANDFYQTFIPRCSGEVVFGGYFSTRGNRSATASVKILNGSGLSGSVVGQTNSISLSGGNSKSDPWTPVNFSTSVTAGQTYSFVVTMDNQANFDEGYVKFTTGCGSYPPDDTLDDGNGGVSTGGIGGTYTGEPGIIGGPAVGVFDPFPKVPNGEHYQCYMLEKSDNIKAEEIKMKNVISSVTITKSRMELKGMICGLIRNLAKIQLPHRAANSSVLQQEKIT